MHNFEVKGSTNPNSEPVIYSTRQSNNTLTVLKLINNKRCGQVVISAEEQDLKHFQSRVYHCVEMTKPSALAKQQSHSSSIICLTVTFIVSDKCLNSYCELGKSLRKQTKSFSISIQLHYIVLNTATVYISAQSNECYILIFRIWIHLLR